MNGAENPEPRVQSPGSCSSLQPPVFPGLAHAPAVLLAIALTLAGLSLVMVYSTGGVLAEKFHSRSFFLVRQLIWVTLGGAAMAVTAHLDPDIYRRRRAWILGIVAFLLTIVLLPGIGTEFNGARRWIRVLGAGFQPSELARVMLVIYMAGHLADTRHLLGEIRKGLVHPALVAAGAVLLIALEPDLGSALLCGAALFAMLLAAGMRWRHVLPLAMVVALAAAALVVTRFDYIWARLLAWWYPEAFASGRGFQAQQSLIALGSGGWLGQGVGASRQKLMFLPEGHTDFILAVVGEELGLVGTGLVVILYLVFIYQGLKIVNLARDPYRMLLGFGLVLMIAAQAAINVAVVTASMPTKGISLPLVSFGGSNIICTMAAIGVLIAIARVESRQRSAVPQKPTPGQETSG